jgi:hypothetical protein
VDLLAVADQATFSGTQKQTLTVLAARTSMGDALKLHLLAD